MAREAADRAREKLETRLLFIAEPNTSKHHECHSRYTHIYRKIYIYIYTYIHIHTYTRTCYLIYTYTLIYILSLL